MDLEELLGQQAGVVTRAQALELGVSGRQLRPGGLLVPVAHGVYAAAHEEPGTAAHLGLRVAAARLTTTVDLVAVGPTAAHLHDLAVLGRRPSASTWWSGARLALGTEVPSATSWRRR